jgi:RNA polymerase sigma factor (sigma-70 family)
VCDESTPRGEGLSKPDLLVQFWAFRPRFLRRIRRLVPGREDAEDVFQTACLKFLRSPAVFRYPEAATRYFCRILRSLALDRLRASRLLEFRDVIPERPCDPWADRERERLLELLAESIARLPAEDREMIAIYLDRHENYIREQSVAFAVARGTARYRMERAVRRLRTIAERYN